MACFLCKCHSDSFPDQLACARPPFLSLSFTFPLSVLAIRLHLFHYHSPSLIDCHFLSLSLSLWSRDQAFDQKSRPPFPSNEGVMCLSCRRTDVRFDGCSTLAGHSIYESSVHKCIPDPSNTSRREKQLKAEASEARLALLPGTRK